MFWFDPACNGNAMEMVLGAEELRRRIATDAEMKPAKTERPAQTTMATAKILDVRAEMGSARVVVIPGLYATDTAYGVVYDRSRKARRELSTPRWPSRGRWAFAAIKGFLGSLLA